MDKIIKFSVNIIELLEEVNNSQFAKVRVQAFASGNNAHDLPVSEETLKKCADTIYDKPLVWYYDEWTDDAGTHNKLEVPCGFVPRENNPVEYIRLEDGRLMMIVNAMIWRRYCGKILSFFERDGMEKPVSVEMQAIESKENNDGTEELITYAFTAITILGTNVRPAIEHAKAEIIQFSKDKQDFVIQSSIDLTFANKSEDLNNTNLVKEDEDVKFSKDHANFEKVAAKFSDVKFAKDNKEFTQYSIFGVDDGHAYCLDKSDMKMMAIPYTKAEDNEEDFSIDFANAKKMKTEFSLCEGDDMPDMDDIMAVMSVMMEAQKEFGADANVEALAHAQRNAEQANADKEAAEKAKAESEQQVTEMSTKMSEMEVKMSDMTKEFERLKKFEADIVENEKKAKVEFALNSVSKTFSKDEIASWRDKVAEFESVDAWSNALKAEAYNHVANIEPTDGIHKFGLPYIENKKPKSDSIWEKL